jgi:hypothetical protein
MAPNLLFYQLLLVALVLICILVHVWWPNHPTPTSRTPLKPSKLRRKRSKEPKPCTGYIPYSQNIQTRLFTGSYPPLISSPSGIVSWPNLLS